uniref:NADH-ubiquinone oxidoreductase chain 6 n=1 Tax=Scolytinae sp. BMNH 1040052 TaxID=1903778 RepID=A0A343A525_9CUCU|nr:NADH dehydrogenase subunit 6 [Scolytinae sp. BMNH 1040052]
MYTLLSSWILSSMLIFLNHPLALGSLLLIQTILISITTGMMFINFWLSYILFLIMVGGMLIMFMYMTSIASNEKFKLPNFKKSMMATMMVVALMMLMMMMWDPSILPLKSSMSNNIQLTQLHMFMSLNKFFNYPNYIMLISLMSYLFLTLIAIVKITDKKMGPMRQK